MTQTVATALIGTMVLVASVIGVQSLREHVAHRNLGAPIASATKEAAPRTTARMPNAEEPHFFRREEATTAPASVGTVSGEITSTGSAPAQTVIDQPVFEGAFETERVVSLSEITQPYLEQRLASMQSDLLLRIAAADNANGTSFLSVSSSLSRASIDATNLTGVVAVAHGGTGVSTSPSYGQVLVGNSSGGFEYVATSSLGIVSGSSGLASYDAFTHEFANQSATTSLLLFNGNASTTAFSSLDGLFVGRTSTTTILGSATSTFGAGIQTTALNVTSGNIGFGTTNPQWFLEADRSSNSASSMGFPTFKIRNTLPTKGDGVTTFNDAEFKVSAGNDAVIGGIWAEYTDTLTGLQVGSADTNPTSIVVNDLPKLTVLNSGNVGIGTQTPVDKLEVLTAGSDNIALNSTSIEGVLAFNAEYNGQVIGSFSTNISSGEIRIGAVTGFGGYFDTFYAGASERMRIASNGNIRFNAYGAGTLTTDASGNITASSDERLKNIEGSFGRGLADLEKLSPIVYKWKAETGFDATTTYAGFSAQNVQLAIPEAVGEGKDGFLTLQDRPILAAIVNAIKEIARSRVPSRTRSWRGSAPQPTGSRACTRRNSARPSRMERKFARAATNSPLSWREKAPAPRRL